jgi:hypothetical protein
MGRKVSNIMMLGDITMMGGVIPSGFVNSFDYTNKTSIDNSKKHKAKAKKAKAKRNRKR